MEATLAFALGSLAITWILFDVGDQTGIINALAIGRRITDGIEVKISASRVQTDLFGAGVGLIAMQYASFKMLRCC